MSVSVIFVDGSGRTREATINEAYPSYRFPIPASHGQSTAKSHRLEDVTKVTHQVATFEPIGRLDDRRYVYGQVEAKYRLWRFRMAWAQVAEPESQMGKRAFFDKLCEEMNTFLKYQYAPRVTLCERTTFDDKTGIYTRVYEGVAKPAEAVADH